MLFAFAEDPLHALNFTSSLLARIHCSLKMQVVAPGMREYTVTSSLSRICSMDFEIHFTCHIDLDFRPFNAGQWIERVFTLD